MTPGKFMLRLRPTGTGCIHFDGGVQVRVGADRLSPKQFSWLLGRGELIDGHMIVGTCGDGACCHPDHLEQVALEGNRLGAAKLTEAQVATVRRAPAASLRRLARVLGVTLEYLRQLRTPAGRARSWVGVGS